ncbi:MAG: ABC transporter permease, partial [Deltaproteobacteria bacterium]
MPDWKQEILKRLAGLKLAPAREAEIAEELSQHLEDRFRELVSRGAAEDEAQRLALEELDCSGELPSPKSVGDGTSPLQQEKSLGIGTSPLQQRRRRDAAATTSRRSETAATANPDELARGLRRVEAEMNQEPVIAGGGGGGNFFASLWQDVRYGARMLRKNPSFTAVAVITLALGIGANAAILSVVNAVVLRPLPYPQSKQLVWISDYVPALKAHLTSGGEYADWKDQNTTLEGIAAYDDSASFNLTGRGTPARVQGARVSANFFGTLSVQPELGRCFTAQEDQPNGPHVAVLMHSFWQQYFGSDPGVLGQTLTLDAAPYTIVGVMPESFKFPGNSETQFLAPLQLNEAQERLCSEGCRMTIVHVIGRLKSNVTVARVANNLLGIHKRRESAALARGPLGPRPSGAPGSGPSAGTGPGHGPNVMIQFEGPGLPPPSGGVRNQPPGNESNSGRFRNQTVPQGPETGRPQEGAPRTGRANPSAQGGAAPQSSQPRTMPAQGNIRRGPGRGFGPPETEVEVVPLAEYLAGNLRPAMLTMLGVVGLVLLIACANVANLMLARASGRTREVAVRAAMGAGRWRLVRQLLTESVLMAFAGGLAGLLLAAWGVRVMTRLIPSSLGGA